MLLPAVWTFCMKTTLGTCYVGFLFQAAQQTHARRLESQARAQDAAENGESLGNVEETRAASA